MEADRRPPVLAQLRGVVRDCAAARTTPLAAPALARRQTHTLCARARQVTVSRPPLQPKFVDLFLLPRPAGDHRHRWRTGDSPMIALTTRPPPTSCTLRRICTLLLTARRCALERGGGSSSDTATRRRRVDCARGAEQLEAAYAARLRARVRPASRRSPTTARRRRARSSTRSTRVAALNQLLSAADPAVAGSARAMSGRTVEAGRPDHHRGRRGGGGGARRAVVHGTPQWESVSAGPAELGQEGDVTRARG